MKKDECFRQTEIERASSQREGNGKTSDFIMKNCVIALSLNPAVFVHLFSKIVFKCADQVSERSCACTRFSVIMEISRWSAALPCGINSLTAIHVRLYLRQHQNNYTHPNSSCNVLLMKTKHVAAAINFGHDRTWEKRTTGLLCDSAGK